MSPTVLRIKGYRFFFFSREEPRKHVHVYCADGEAKFWLEPEISLAKSYGLNPKQLNEIEKLVREHYEVFIKAWQKFFES